MGVSVEVSVGVAVVGAVGDGTAVTIGVLGRAVEVGLVAACGRGVGLRVPPVESKLGVWNGVARTVGAGLV